MRSTITQHGITPVAIAAIALGTVVFLLHTRVDEPSPEPTSIDDVESAEVVEPPPDDRPVDDFDTDISARYADYVEHNSRRIVDRIVAAPPPAAASVEQIEEELGSRQPEQWGEFVDGVHRRLDTDDDVVALTFDACDRGYDPAIIEILRRHRIPATLFVSGFFVDAHPEILEELADDPLFEIANHGLRHLPCSVTGRSAAGIDGTTSVADAWREIDENARKIEEVTGQTPRFYRSGTAYYDEVCTAVARRAGHHVAGFDVVGDMGATYTADQIARALDGVQPGSIVVLHMNKPEREISEGFERALPRLKERNFEFVRLSDVPLR